MPNDDEHIWRGRELQAYTQGFSDAMAMCRKDLHELGEKFDNDVRQLRAELRRALGLPPEPDWAKGDPGHRFQ